MPSADRTLTFDADIAAPPEVVFDTVVDLDGQSRWLSRSMAFHGTRLAAAGPCVVGTTYREPGPLGVRNGVVTVCDRPSRVVFDQPMRMHLGLGTLGIVATVVLTPTASGSTQLHREVALTFPRLLRRVQATVIPLFVHENRRVLRRLQAHCEEMAAGAAQGR